ncbi:PREDICTED: uncharacterized protein LOC109187441 [Ipomoea nil]|uniref:uncharacterized protein LOC109187441 n=1 Tax=Ipomoea nil TaxID=35883 RepID=UPI0009013155|nr:PREDICTED: uncharacterized protein LOC109187441 [Ipomoea nil]
MHGYTLQGFMDAVVGAPNPNKAVRMAAVMWVIWSERNDRIWRDLSRGGDQLKNQITNLQIKWQRTFKSMVPGGQVRVNPVNWEPPKRNWLKCNVDATVLASGVAFGAAVRDHNGVFVATKNGRLNCDCDPFTAEATVVKESLQWLRSLGRNDLIIEIDCLNFCKAFNSSSFLYSYVDLIVKQCNSVASDIGNVFVRHVKRSANQVAHVLAWATDFTSGSSSWTEVPPFCISAMLIH